MNQHAVKVKQQNVASAKIASLEKELTAAQTAVGTRFSVTSSSCWLRGSVVV
jgi:hypothetical protein